jgi:hypothetical protein
MMRADRRRIDRPNLSPFELHVARICRNTNSNFVGIQKAYPEYGLQALIIVLNANRSSLAIPVTEFSVGRLLVELERSERPWKEAEGRQANVLARLQEVQS